MESMFVWIVVFAGVAIALLGAVLVASERELKTKRREVEVLFGKLESVSPGNTPAQSGALLADHSAELTELRATNQDLQNQIAALSGKLDLSRRSIEELKATQQSNTGAQRELDGLQAANDQLKSELNDLRSRLLLAEGQFQGSSEAGQDRAQSQAQIANLQHSLDASHTKIRELESALQKAPNLAEIEAKHRQEQKSLQLRIAELESEIGAGREKLQEFEAMSARAADSERAQQTLREEIRRHEEVISRWQARISEAEEHRQRLAALQTPYNELLVKHASLADKQREIQADLAAFAQLIAVPTRAAQAPSSSTATSAASAVGNSVNNHSTDEDPAAEPEPKRAHRFGIFSVIIMLAAGAAVGRW
ncbi:MAG TPA: hypothetical protein VF977_15730 [Candidatus Binatia bacterium]